MKPYRGNEPFIFISYSHKDTEQVLPIVEEMARTGFRIWFDAGIELGGRWDNDIATHIRDCCIFIPFFTENYLASKNCTNELRYALSKDCKCLAVYLEPVSFESEPGIEMYVNVNQNIMGYKVTPEQLRDRLLNADALQECREHPDMTMPVIFEVPAEEEPDTTEEQIHTRLFMPSDPPPVKPAARHPVQAGATGELPDMKWYGRVFWPLMLVNLLAIFLSELVKMTTDRRSPLGHGFSFLGIAVFGLIVILLQERKLKTVVPKMKGGYRLRWGITAVAAALSALNFGHLGEDYLLWITGLSSAAVLGVIGWRMSALKQMPGLRRGMLCFSWIWTVCGFVFSLMSKSICYISYSKYQYIAVGTHLLFAAAFGMIAFIKILRELNGKRRVFALIQLGLLILFGLTGGIGMVLLNR